MDEQTILHSREEDTLEARLVRAYNGKDDCFFDRVLQDLLNREAFLPAAMEVHVTDWLRSNEKAPNGVRWGRFPLGMVQRWIERAQQAEAELNAAKRSLLNAILPNREQL